VIAPVGRHARSPRRAQSRTCGMFQPLGDCSVVIANHEALRLGARGTSVFELGGENKNVSGSERSCVNHKSVVEWTTLHN